MDREGRKEREERDGTENRRKRRKTFGVTGKGSGWVGRMRRRLKKEVMIGLKGLRKRMDGCRMSHCRMLGLGETGGWMIGQVI